MDNNSKITKNHANGKCNHLKVLQNEIKANLNTYDPINLDANDVLAQFTTQSFPKSSTLMTRFSFIYLTASLQANL